VRTPIEAPEEEVEEYSEIFRHYPKEFRLDESYDVLSKLRQNNPTYAAMVTAVDRSVGRIMETLDQQGLGDNTVIILTSDNGGKSTVTNKTFQKMYAQKPDRRSVLSTSNLPLRHGKGWVYEGGIRVPLIIYAPGVNASVSQCPVTGADIFPTMLDLAGLAELPDIHKDGLSLKSEMDTSEDSPGVCRKDVISKRTLFWHAGNHNGIRTTGNPRATAIRKGRWKLIKNHDNGNVELYDIISDEEEQNNNSNKFGERTKNMTNELTSLLEQIQGTDAS